MPSPLRVLVGRAVIVALVMTAGCAGDTAVPTETRIADTAALLEAFLTPDAAQREAENLVTLCRTDSEEMFFTLQNRLWDPDGSELFDSLDEAEAAGTRIVGATGIRGVGEAACTPDDLDAAQAHGEI